jgi:molybdate transport system substrate-binding protein
MAIRPVTAFALLCVVLMQASGTSAKAADMMLLSTIAAKAAVEEIAPAFERATGHHLNVRFGLGADLKTEIEKGAACDVALLTEAVIDDLIKQNRLTQASRAYVARSGVGIAVKLGAAVPTITTGEELKQALLAAKSIAYSAKGATGPILKKIFERYAITEAMQGKIVLVTATTAPEAVALDQAELGFTQISEILDARGARLVGPLPAELQVYTTFAAATAASTKNPAAAQAFVDFLGTAATKAVLKARGLEPRN